MQKFRQSSIEKGMKSIFLFGGIILTFPGYCRGNGVLSRASTASRSQFKSTKVELTENSQRDFNVGFSVYPTSFEMFPTNFFLGFLFFLI